MLKKIKEHLRYRIDNVFSRGTNAQLGFLLILTILVTLFGMLAYFIGLYSSENKAISDINRNLDQGFWDTLWWSMKQVVKFNSSYGATIPIVLISFIITILGMFIYGALIGLISTSFRTRLDALKAGGSPVKEKKHILILGWNAKIFSILKLLIDYEKIKKVVILSNHEVFYMQNQLKLAGYEKSPLKIVLRSGSPTNLSELERVAFDHAFSIIVLADESGTSSIKEDPDLRVIKTLMLLTYYKDWKIVRPKMVAEICRKENYEVANVAANNRIPIITNSDVVSKIIVQSSRQSGLSTVYSEIFAFYGNEIYIKDFPQCAGQKFGDIIYKFPNAIAIGISQTVQEGQSIKFLPVINPASDYIIKDKEWLILIALDDRIIYNDSLPIYVSPLNTSEILEKKELEKILILGWNNNIYTILLDFDQYVKSGTQITIISNYEENDAIKNIKENIYTNWQNIQITFHKGDYTKRQVLKNIPIGDLDCVIILADEAGSSQNTDSRTIISLILLRDLQKEIEYHKDTQFVSEIIVPQNKILLETTKVNDIIISPEIVSMMLTQLSLQQMLYNVYADLLSPEGSEIYLKPSNRYMKSETPCSFKDIMYFAQKKNEIAIGVKLKAEEDDKNKNYGVHINPDKDTIYRFNDEDKVIVLAEDL